MGYQAYEWAQSGPFIEQCAKADKKFPPENMKNEPGSKFWKPKGVLVAALTPMKADLSVDSALMSAHCKWLLANGADGLVISGTTGEANSLSVSEREELLDALVAAGVPAERMIVGTGCCAFPDTVKLTKHAINHGVAGVLMLPPFYYKNITEEGLIASFDTVIQRIGSPELRIYLYHFPQMSGTPIPPNTIEALLKRYTGQIVGIKDSSGDFQNMRRMADSFEDFQVFAGSEAFLLDILRVGGVGCISATANVTCSVAAELYANWQASDADDRQMRLTELRLGLQNFPAPFVPMLKQLFAHFSGDNNWLNMRPPHVALNPLDVKDLQRLLASLNFDISSITTAGL